MATLPAFVRTNETPLPIARTQRDPFELRPLPFEDVFFYCKRVDNSRLVREPDPKAGNACWSAMGVASVILALLLGVLAPNVASTLSGYKLESLRAEQRQLLDERRTLDLQEAELLSPARLDQLAKDENLVTPSAGQVVHLERGADGAVAMVK